MFLLREGINTKCIEKAIDKALLVNNLFIKLSLLNVTQIKE